MGDILSRSYRLSHERAPMKAWATYAFNEMRLEEIPFPQLKPGWAVVMMKVVQPSITEAQLFRGERSSGFDLVEEGPVDGPRSFSETIFARGSWRSTGVTASASRSETRSRQPGRKRALSAAPSGETLQFAFVL